ncbi:DUF5828 family protein [Natrinema sp. DC36]|uniref:DUF5828 family protein n=1 Tax=Natrinema sp. DC36 TaxID=2878680 RepID=UPI001CF07F4A|nr:DUF5828 family protein [Natrinema sp. DC36]
MEESISGFKTRGSWSDIIEHGERITRALREVHMSDDTGRYDSYFPSAFDEWENWRPKAHETLEAEISEKTAAQASVGEGAGERVGKTSDEDIRTAGEKLASSYELLEADNTEAAVDNWSASIAHVVRAADTTGRKALRRVENTVYQNVMTQLAPYYFDNRLISANVQQSIRRESDPQFAFEVNINDDDLKDEVSTRLSRIDERVDRWHVNVRKNTAAAEAIEGVEAPPDKEDRVDPTTN